MNFELLHQPDSAIAKISLQPGEELVAQAGAMVAMSGHINASTTLRQGKGGGVLGGLRRMVAGESLFLSVFRAAVPGDVYLAPRLMGDLLVYPMAGKKLIVQSGSYLASEPEVDIDLGFQGFKSVFSGEGLFWLTITGHGQVLLTSFGGIYEIAVDGEYVVDTGHIVAFEDGLAFSITKPPGSSWLGAFLGGEGFVCRFKGHGKVYCQTHNNYNFGQTVGGRLPPR